MNTKKRERRLAQNLSALRTAHKYSAAHLDKQFNLPSGTWTRYERGEDPPPDITLQIKNFFRVDMFDLLYKNINHQNG